MLETHRRDRCSIKEHMRGCAPDLCDCRGTECCLAGGSRRGVKQHIGEHLPVTPKCAQPPLDSLSPRRRSEFQQNRSMRRHLQCQFCVKASQVLVLPEIAGDPLARK